MMPTKLKGHMEALRTVSFQVTLDSPGPLVRARFTNSASIISNIEARIRAVTDNVFETPGLQDLC